MPDVAVVGAGIAGASVAFAAARRGASVVVVDDRRAGRATAAGAGIIAPWATALTGEVYDLYAAGADGYPSLLEAFAEIGIDDVGYRRNGALVLADDEARAADTLTRLAARTIRSAVAGKPELVDADPVAAMFPPIRRGQVGVHVPGGARVDGRALAAALLDGVRHHGGRVVDGVATADDGRVTVGGDVLHADAVVIAAGAWTPSLVAPRPIALAAQRGQICHLRLPDASTGDWPSVLPPADHYMVPFDDGRVVVGATREDGVDDVRVTAGGVALVLAQAIEVAPGLREATLIETRVGLRPYPTADHRPTIGRIGERSWVATGFGAIGLTIGPTVGERLAAMILDDHHDDHHDELLAPFAPT